MKKIKQLVAATVLSGVALQANAVPMLRITDLSDPATPSVTVTDSLPSDGIVTMITGLGTWVVNVVTGLSKPLIGAADEPYLDLSSVNVSMGSGVLQIEFTDTDFNLAGSTQAMALIGGTTEGTVSFATYYDASNTPFGRSNELMDLGVFDSGAFAGEAGTAFLAPALYSLTLVVTIAHKSGIDVSSFDAAVRVPEPASLLLLSVGMLAIGFAVARRRRRSRE